MDTAKKAKRKTINKATSTGLKEGICHFDTQRTTVMKMAILMRYFINIRKMNRALFFVYNLEINPCGLIYLIIGTFKIALLKTTARANTNNKYNIKEYMLRGLLLLRKINVNATPKKNKKRELNKWLTLQKTLYFFNFMMIVKF